MNLIKKLTSYNGSYWFCMVIFFLIMISPLVCEIFEVDMYFILPEGKYILQTGVLPDTNRFIVDDSQLIIHQWLYAVLCALFFYSFNESSVTLYFLIVLQIALLLFIMYKYCRLYFKNTHFELCVYAVFFLSPYFHSIRPELITIIIMLLEIYCFEKYKITGKSKWLFILPLVIILMVNFHAVMWPIIYAILLAYMVPSVLPKVYNSDNIKLNVPFGISILLSFVCIGLNPYGYDVIPLVIKAMRISSLFHNYVNELKPFLFCIVNITQKECAGIGVTYIALITLSVILIIICFVKRVKLNSSTLYLYCGFTLMLFMNIRNSMFFVVGLALLLCSIIRLLEANSFLDNVRNNFTIVFKEKWLNRLLCVCVCIFGMFIIIFNIFWFIILYNSKFEDMYVPTNMTTDVIDFLDDSSSDGADGTIFSWFNYYSYLEYHGFDNLYMDVRMEYLDDDAYNRAFNYLELVLAEDLNDIELIGYDSVDDFIEHYDFSYFILTEGMAPGLIEYLDSHPDKYECVCFNNPEADVLDDDTISDEGLYLECIVYKRIKN